MDTAVSRDLQIIRNCFGPGIRKAMVQIPKIIHQTWKTKEIPREFESFVDNLLQTVNQDPIIIGVGDMVLDNNLIERVKHIADRVAAQPLERHLA